MPEIPHWSLSICGGRPLPRTALCAQTLHQGKFLRNWNRYDYGMLPLAWLLSEWMDIYGYHYGYLWTMDINGEDALEELKGDILEALLQLDEKTCPRFIFWFIGEEHSFLLQVIEKCTSDLASGKAFAAFLDRGKAWALCKPFLNFRWMVWNGRSEYTWCLGCDPWTREPQKNAKPRRLVGNQLLNGSNLDTSWYCMNLYDICMIRDQKPMWFLFQKCILQIITMIYNNTIWHRILYTI